MTRRPVTLTIELPDGIAERAEELAIVDPEFLSCTLELALMRRAVRETSPPRPEPTTRRIYAPL